jgi:hypothetical protein
MIHRTSTLGIIVLYTAALFMIIVRAPGLVSASEVDILDYREVVRANLDDLDTAEPIAEEVKKALKAGLYANAMLRFTEALKIATEADWYYNLGNAYFYLEIFEECQQAFEIAARLGNSHEDFAYYTAARAVSMREAKFRSLYNFELSLIHGYRDLANLHSDPDIKYLRSLNEFERLIKVYFPPRQVSSISACYSEIPAEIDHIRLDIDGDSFEELIVAVSFEQGYVGEAGSYYFALYEQEAQRWNLINQTIPKLISVPVVRDSSNHWLWSEFRLDERSMISGSFILRDLDSNSGTEVIVPAIGLTYYAGKILDYVEGRLQEIGEVEGFETIHNLDGTTLLIGHEVTDYAFGDGTSEKYSAYAIDNHELIEVPVPQSSVSVLEAAKTDDFQKEPSITTLSSLFWFLYNHNNLQLTKEWVDKNAVKLPPSRSRERFIEAMHQALDHEIHSQ